MAKKKKGEVRVLVKRLCKTVLNPPEKMIMLFYDKRLLNLDIPTTLPYCGCCGEEIGFGNMIISDNVDLPLEAYCLSSGCIDYKEL